MTKRNYKSEFIQKAKILYGDNYSYEKANIISSKCKVVITCKEHGDFEKRTDHFLNGSACPKRKGGYSLARRRDTFLRKSKAVHLNKYDYSSVNYEHSRKPIDIKCPIHGIFSQVPNDHVSGKGCAACGAEYSSGWSRSDYIRKCSERNRGLSTLYVVKCFSGSELFYKVGITSTDIKTRFYKIPYEYDVVYEIEGEAGSIYDLENDIHREIKSLAYQPSMFFNGHTECFSTVAPIDSLLKKLASNE